MVIADANRKADNPGIGTSIANTNKRIDNLGKGSGIAIADRGVDSSGRSIGTVDIDKRVDDQSTGKVTSTTDIDKKTNNPSLDIRKEVKNRRAYNKSANYRQADKRGIGTKQQAATVSNSKQ